MKPMNEMELSFPSCSANEGFARAAVAAFVAQLDPTVDELCDIKTAVSEAVTNCIVHAYRSTIGTIYISCHIYENGRVVVKVRDKGCGIDEYRASHAADVYDGGGGARRAWLRGDGELYGQPARFIAAGQGNLRHPAQDHPAASCAK